MGQWMGQRLFMESNGPPVPALDAATVVRRSHLLVTATACLTMVFLPRKNNAFSVSKKGSEPYTSYLKWCGYFTRWYFCANNSIRFTTVFLKKINKTVQSLSLISVNYKLNHPMAHNILHIPNYSNNRGPHKAQCMSGFV